MRFLKIMTLNIRKLKLTKLFGEMSTRQDTDVIVLETHGRNNGRGGTTILIKRTLERIAFSTT